MRLQSDVAARLRDELKSNAAAALESRKTLNYPIGRFPLEYSPDFFSTQVVSQQNARPVAQLLEMGAYLSLEDNQPDPAMESIHALLNIGRYYEDEPLLISTLIRLAFQSMAIRGLERTLAQGAVAENVLTPMQRLLADEAAAEVFLVGMRGERATMHGYFNFLVSSDTPVPVAIMAMANGRASEASWWDYAIDIRARTMVYRSNAWLLQHQTKMVESRHVTRQRSLPCAPRNRTRLSRIRQDARLRLDAGPD